MIQTEELRAEVTNIQRLCTHDGPGIRTTVFLAGCPLRCWWCHNPETRRFPSGLVGRQIFYSPQKCIGCMACREVCPAQAHEEQQGAHMFYREKCIGCAACAKVCPTKALEVVSREMKISEILTEVEKDRAFYGEKGGLTLSGGEPLFQHQAAFALLEGAKSMGISTAVESCGFFSRDYCQRLVDCTDLFLFDVKDTDSARHQKNTGVPLKPILQNLCEIDRLGGETILRCILIEGVNLEQDHAQKLGELWRSLRHCRQVELLPYHAMGASKWKRLGLSSRDEERFVPEPERLQQFQGWLEEEGVQVKK